MKKYKHEGKIEDILDERRIESLLDTENKILRQVTKLF